MATFTYGVLDSSKVTISRGAAGALESDQFTVDLDPVEVTRSWAGSDDADLQRRTWGLTSLPHAQDWYALPQVRRKALIDTDAAFLPGHAIVGNMYDEHPLEGSPSCNEVLTTAARHHSLLQGDRDVQHHLPLLHWVVVQGTQGIPFPTNPDKNLPGDGCCVQELLRWVNLQERQVKYINKPFNAHEAFRYGWVLSMLDTEMWCAWLRGSKELTATRDRYAQFMAEVYGGTTGTASQLFEAPTARTSAGPQRALMATLTVTGIHTALSWAVSVCIMLRHSMVFEALNAPIPYIEQTLYMSRGAVLAGL